MFNFLMDILSSPLEFFYVMWLYYLGALILAETLLYLKITRGKKIAIYAAGCALILFVLLFSYNEKARILAPIVGVILYGIPIALIMGGVAAISKIKKPWIRQAAILTAIFLMMPFYPLWALYVVCLSGLSCI